MTKPVMYVGAAIYAPEDPFATAMLVENGTIAWMGTHAAAKSIMSDAMTVVDVEGALIAPAFVDSHAHITETGRHLATLQLDHVRSKQEFLDELSRYAKGLDPKQRVLASGWDETLWNDPASQDSSDADADAGANAAVLPTVAELDRAVGSRPAYVLRRDLHTALASSAALTAAGLEVPSGDLDGAWMSEHEHHALREWALTASDDELRSWQRTALSSFAKTGHALVTEMSAPHVSGCRDLDVLLAVGEEEAQALPSVHAFWAQLVETEAEARALADSFTSNSRYRRLAGLGGDLSMDGSIGAYTAALRHDYADAPGEKGQLLLTPQQVAAHVIACVNAGIPTGFHAIGDAALDTLLEGYRLAAEEVGARAIRQQRHRIEHAEMLDSQHIEAMLEFGLTASVQPRFDELWGHAGDMYEARLGVERAASMNPFGSLSAAGVPLVFGSDAPVTHALPWKTIRAAMHHHDADQTLPARAGFLAHTRAGYRALNIPDPTAGVLRWGAAATFAIWEPSELVVGSADLSRTSFSTDARARTPMLPDLEAASLPECWATVRHGKILWDGKDLHGELHSGSEGLE